MRKIIVPTLWVVRILNTLIVSKFLESRAHGVSFTLYSQVTGQVGGGRMTNPTYNNPGRLYICRGTDKLLRDGPGWHCGKDSLCTEADRMI